MNNLFLYNPFTKKIKTIEEVKENRVPNLADEMRQLAKIEKQPLEEKIESVTRRIRIAAEYFYNDLVFKVNQYSKQEIQEIIEHFESLGFDVEYEEFRNSGNKWITIEWK